MAISGQIVNVGDHIDVSYSGGVQRYEIPFTGLYQLEVWGAQGGGYNSYGGKGGYSKGYIKLSKSTLLEIVCGGVGLAPWGQGSGYVITNSGGYNGGGNACGGGAYATASGGGATHIANGNRGVLENYVNNKNEVLIVAGGGGGGTNPTSGHTYKQYGGSGGGLNGSSVTQGGTGGTQNTGGSNITIGGSVSDTTYASAKFGKGGEYVSGNTTEHWITCCGGGGGWYGGGCGIGTNYADANRAGGGGSGYIGGVPQITYKGIIYEPETSNGVNNGNGKATIRYVAKAFPEMYVGDVPVEGAYVGTEEVIGFYEGDITL